MSPWQENLMPSFVASILTGDQVSKGDCMGITEEKAPRSEIF